MRRALILVGFAALLLAATTLSSPRMNVTRTALSADAGTKLCAGLSNRTHALIQNLDSQPVWVGPVATVNASTGAKVGAGLTVDFPIGYESAGKSDIYGYSAAGQSAPADTICTETR